MAVYDSAKIRNVSAMIDRLARSMDTEVKHGIRDAAECQDSFHGKTSQAIEEKLEQLVRMANGLEEELGQLARKVGQYADMLERADEQLAEKL